MAKGLLLQSEGGENGAKNNVKESIVPVFYIIIYRVSSQYIMLMKYISRCFQNPIVLSLSAQNFTFRV